MAQFKNKYVHITLKDGILLISYTPNIQIDLEVAKEMVTGRVEAFGGKSYPMLGDVTTGIKMTKEAREYFNSKESIIGINAGAFLINNVIERFIGNMWLKMSPPPIPFKLFTNREEALKWLNVFKHMN